MTDEIAQLLAFKRMLVMHEIVTELIRLTEKLRADFMAAKPSGDPLVEADWRGSVDILDRMIEMHRGLLKTDGPKHLMDKDFIKLMAQELEKKLPDNWGFLLMAAPYGEDQDQFVYTSTIRRVDALKMLKEFIIKCGAGEDWMKHLE